MAAPASLLPAVCTACTSNCGPCLTHCQARINQLDAGQVCAGNLCVSGLLQCLSASMQTLATSTLNVDLIQPLNPVPGNVRLPNVALGSQAYGPNPSAVLLNGQQLQPVVLTSPGLVSKLNANGSLIYILGGATYVLDSGAVPGTFFFFYNAGAVAAALSVSSFGGIQKGVAAPVATYALVAGAAGVVVNSGASIWVLMLSA